MRNFASTLVKFSKLSHIQTMIWRPPKMAPPRTAGSAGPFVTPLGCNCPGEVRPASLRRAERRAQHAAQGVPGGLGRSNTKILWN